MCITRRFVFNQGTAWSFYKLKQDWFYWLVEYLKCQSTGKSLKSELTHKTTFERYREGWSWADRDASYIWLPHLGYFAICVAQ